MLALSEARPLYRTQFKFRHFCWFYFLSLQSNSNIANDRFSDFSENNNDAFESSESNKDDQGDMSFCMSNYARETMKMMLMMRSHHMLTDVVIEVQQELFHAHKVVLSAASPYFKAMFTGGLRESELSRVKLQGVGIHSYFHYIYQRQFFWQIFLFL